MMDFLPDRLLAGIRGAKRVVPNKSGFNHPTTTLINNSAKVTHMLSKLAQAGVVDGATNILGLPSTTSTVHAEKITHTFNQLSNAGLADAGTSADSTSTKSSGGGLATKYIIIIAVVSAAVLLALLTGGCICFRRYKRRRAYNVVSRGIDTKGKGPLREKEDMFNADLGEAESFNVSEPGQKLTERNFESGYDKVDTGYDGTGYGGVDEHAGDKRARLEA
jgi:hypothetical protein